MREDGVQFHNVEALERVDSRDGVRLQRVPESVRRRLNEGARTRMCHPAGAEIRFVPSGTVRVTLSSDVRESLVRPFWGDFQAAGDEEVVGEDPRTIALSVPSKLSKLRPAAEEGLRFAPNVCRLVLPGDHRGGHVYFHGVEGDARPPTADEVPDRRYLAYGTSITEGEAPSAETVTYVNQVARRLGADALNLGSCGTAYCDPAMAEHVADRDDWDVATLSLSVNMVGRFSVEEFRERARSMVDTVAAAHPDAPIACVTLFPHYRDYVADDDAAVAESFREALREVVADCERENVHLFEGPELLPTAGGMTTDLVHPGDDAMIRIGEALADRLEPLLSE